MGIGRPISWDDLTVEVQKVATRQVMKRTSLSLNAAENVVVDAMIKLIRLRPIARDPQSLLITAAVNLHVTHGIHEAARPDRLATTRRGGGAQEILVSEGVHEQALDPATRVAEDELGAMRAAKLNGAFARLSESDRALLTAYYFEERSLVEIDSERGNPRGAAKVAIFRARERLRGLITAGLHPRRR